MMEEKRDNRRESPKQWGAEIQYGGISFYKYKRRPGGSPECAKVHIFLRN